MPSRSESTHSLLSTTIKSVSARGGRAMGVFVTSGFPDAEATRPILDAIVAGGADFVELGMPFSDPLAEGIPIQRSSERALRGGSNLDRTFAEAESFTDRHDVPLILMGYYNPILQYGISNFCERAKSSGVAGLIIPDLPPEESGPLATAVDQCNLDLIFLVAPNTSSDRIRSIDVRSSGFVYAVSTTGVTGGELDAKAAIDNYLQRTSTLVTKNPLMVGFGIRSGSDARDLSRHTDGFIVGSAVVSLIESLWGGTESVPERCNRITEFVRSLRP